jgi:hypothetical protein
MCALPGDSIIAKQQWIIQFNPGVLAMHRDLTRIIHEASTAAADPGMSTALHFFGLLDVLSSTPPGPQKITYLHLARIAKHHACLRRLAANLHE